MRNKPFLLIILGFFLILIPWVYYLLLTIHVITIKNATLGYILLFAGYVAGVAGLFMGIIGAATYYSTKRKK